MSFLKKEVKRIGYLAKPLQPPSSLYETTYSSPQVLPSVVPLQKRRRMTISPVEYFYEEPFNEIMKKMEKEEVQQQTESLMRSLAEEQYNQEFTRRFMEMTPEQVQQVQDYMDLRRLAKVDKNVAFRLAKQIADERDLKKAKEQLLDKNRWLNLEDSEDMVESAMRAINSSPFLTLPQKYKFISDTNISSKDLATYALIVEAVPYILEHKDIRVLTDLMRDKLKIPINPKKQPFYQVRGLLQDTFDAEFKYFLSFLDKMKTQQRRSALLQLKGH